jgi:hypothetical protein
VPLKVYFSCEKAVVKENRTTNKVVIFFRIIAFILICKCDDLLAFLLHIKC